MPQTILFIPLDCNRENPRNARVFSILPRSESIAYYRACDRRNCLDNRCRHNGCRRDDRRCRHHRSRGDNHRRRRRNECRTDHAADHATDESRPEIASATSPITAMMVVMMMPTMVMHHRTRSMMPTAMMESMRRANARAQYGCKSHNHCHFSLHLSPFLSTLFGCLHTDRYV